MFVFDNTYARLPDRFYARVAPTAVRAPRVVKVNRALCELLGVDADRASGDEGARVLSGNDVPDGAEPIALAYAGHQFGSFVRQLGDGRAILLGEVVGKDGRRRDVQLKGAGRTPFSRGGDGRAALGPVLREYLVSEAMFALGVPTTRALSAVTTGEPVFREEPLPGAVLTRVASSHLRVGTFEFFAAREDKEALSVLTAYALKRHYPDAVNEKKPAAALLEKVIEAQAELVARWLGIGFVHGVMNTDNTSISGETIDYGPCAFLDTYDPRKRFSSIDRGGRYAFAEQPRIALWNLARLAEALLPLFDDDEDAAVREATDRLERFPALFESAHARVLRSKLGLVRQEPGDLLLAHDLLQRMAQNAVDFTLCFRRLCAAAQDPAADDGVASLFAEPSVFREWSERWRTRAASETTSPEERAAAMRRVNPAFIPRNHRVEEALAAAHHEDFTPFETLSQVLSRPYDDQPDHAHLADPPAVIDEEYRTFCGT
jgi:serine/tyrosine/threonine adenylyltransferase